MVTRQPRHGRHDRREGELNDEDADVRTTAGCEDVASYVLGVLEPEQQMIFARHLTGCADCRRDAAEFGAFASALRQSAGQGAFTAGATVIPVPCRVTRNVTQAILMVAAGFVVAVMAVLSVVESLSTHADEPVDTRTLTHAQGKPFSLFHHV